MKADEWRKIGGLVHMQTCRTGWKGMWDIFHSMITRAPLYTIAQKFEVEMYAKSNAEDVTFWVNGIRLERKYE